MLVDVIRERMKAAMKARRTVEKEILRLVLGEIQTEEARGGTGLADADVERIVRKLIKSNRETIASTGDDATRAELTEEVAVLESLLPEQLDVDGIVAALAEVADAVKGAAADGQAIGVAMKHLKSRGLSVDGSDVAAAVKKMRA